MTDVVQRQRYASAARDDGEHPDRIQAMFYLLNCYQLQGKMEEVSRIHDELSQAIDKLRWEGSGSHHVLTQRLLEKRFELEAARRASAVQLRGHRCPPTPSNPTH